MTRKADITGETKSTRCAVYCRVSTDEGLGQEFNSLDAQRESGEAFVSSRKPDGWTCLSDHYDDGGYSGGNLERPALKRLLVDIEAGLIDAIVCYKVDRLSRSLLDFSRLIDVFDRHRVMFVSVTQPINTGDSSGRLMLNVLLSFAQFEREMIADRTRDKMGAARKKGKWTGGYPPLGYDVHPDGGRLVENEEEAEAVRQIFSLYLDQGSLQATAAELNRRGWRTKSWVTRSGTLREGVPFSVNLLSRLLNNPVYVGRVSYRGETYEGEHPAIVNQEVFGSVQELLASNGRGNGARAKNRYGHLLRGLLHCSSCNCAMSPGVTVRRKRAHRYYICGNATRTGWKNCPHPSLSAGQIEGAVIERIRCIGKDSALVDDTLAELKSLRKRRQPAIDAERRRLDRELLRLRDLGRDEDQVQVGKIDARLLEIDDELSILKSRAVNRRDLSRALEMFDEVWSCLFPREQERVLNLLIERVDFDAKRESLAIIFKPTGIRALSEEIVEAQEATA